MIAQVHEEELALGKDTEGLGADKGESVAAKPVEEQKLEEGQITGDPTPEEPSKEVKETTSRNRDPETITSAAKIHSGTLDIPDATRNAVAVPPSALVIAKIIEDLRLIAYPEGITGPKQELNMNSEKGKFIYDREFLLQFMEVCTEKPDVPLGVVGLETVSGQPHYPLSRGSGRHRITPQSMPLQAPKSSFQLDIPGGSAAANFSLTSNERVAAVQPSTSYMTVGPTGKRIRSKRGKECNKLNDAHDANTESVTPLVASANRWTKHPLTGVGLNIERKVKALLNKLTMAKFDPVSDRIVEWANKSEVEKDGRALILVTRLVFESATRTTWPEMYALLCRKIMEKISPNVQDDGIRDAGGKPIIGGQLFRKFLLNHCKKDFERCWAAIGSEDTPIKKASETSSKVEFYSDEYAAQKARRQALGLVQFIGELYKLQMLTERVMHEYIKIFLTNNPEEVEIEGLCRLLTTAGKLLDKPKARANIDVYFAKVEKLRKNDNVVPRMRFMLQELIELRERKWSPRHQVASPAQIDGWAVAGGSTPRPPQKARDLSNFGKITKSGPPVIGPSTIWASKKDGAKCDGTLARVNSTSNMFMMLGRGAEAMDETHSKPIRPSDGMTGVGLGAGGTPEPQHRRAKLLSRQEPVEAERGVNGSPADHPTDKGGDGAPPAMSEAEAYKKIAKDAEEFFVICDVDESEKYFVKLPPGHRHRLVEEMVSMAVASGEANGKLVAGAFARAVEKNVCPISTFEEGFLPVAELLDYIVVDNPKAIQIMATVMKGAGLDKDEKRRTRIAQKSMDGDKLLELLA